MQRIYVLLLGAVAIIAIIAGVFIFGTRRSSNSATPTPSASVTREDAVQTQTLDATDKNPGISINPIDKGKSIETDEIKFTLLDVRQDVNGQTYGNKKVYLVKMQVERFKNDSKRDPEHQTGVSVADIDLATITDYDRVRDTGKGFDVEFFYDRAKLGVTLSQDVRSLKVGQKAVGYFTFDATSATDTGPMYVIIRYNSADSVRAGKMSAIAGTLQVR